MENKYDGDSPSQVMHHFVETLQQPNDQVGMATRQTNQLAHHMLGIDYIICNWTAKPAGNGLCNYHNITQQLQQGIKTSVESSIVDLLRYLCCNSSRRSLLRFLRSSLLRRSSSCSVFSWSTSLWCASTFACSFSARFLQTPKLLLYARDHDLLQLLVNFLYVKL